MGTNEEFSKMIESERNSNHIHINHGAYGEQWRISKNNAKVTIETIRNQLSV